MRAKIVNEIYHQAYGQLEVQSRDILTPTQLDVLKLWAKGLDIEQISNSTLASRGTVRNQFTALRARLLARDNSAAVQLAIDCGMLEPFYKR